MKCHGLWGTYDDGKKWLEEGDGTRPRCVMHMGSSIGESGMMNVTRQPLITTGNFTRNEAADFLGQFANVMRPDDMFLLGVDSCEKPEKV